ncbi:Thaumatin-like protein 1 [Hibiscus syriacus]|uniref:Thaumatin-like protein 1 n=1 Tax=Hibiscus syriacus TaxID=106335 RepID=A0A6A3ABB9_HIBSY|nr:Thaumatin-like protein 1 [Hibiscus syriacus]
MESGECTSTGCLTDLNKKCPSELLINGGGACKSTCDAFGNPEYCCSGAYNSPAACKPSTYSQVFKSVCPKSYSYAFDDVTSTFTCTGADYTITFCPNVSSLKSSQDPATAKATGLDPVPEPVQASALASQWLANLATGDSKGIRPFPVIRIGFAIAL